MKTFRCILGLTLATGLTGCVSVEKRIQAHQAAFDHWPADVQAAVRAGKIDLGFTKEQVTVAAGQPDRVLARTSDSGQEEIWVYRDKGPRFSIGVGVSTGSYGGGRGAMLYNNHRADDSLDDATRVIFKDDKVTAIEERRQ